MELTRAGEMYNEAAEKFNGLLERYNAMKKENEELKAALENLRKEAVDWKRAFFNLQETMEQEKTAAE